MTARRALVPGLLALLTVLLVVVGVFLLVDRPGSVQANVRFGGDAPHMSDPSYAAVQVADAIFTGLFSSRLIANLREDKGYTYGSYSVMRHQRAGSSLAVGVDVATDVAAPALVVGHPSDPIHPAADAAMLAGELPHAEFVQATSILEWRARPERLNAAALDFALECWQTRASPRRTRA